MGEDINLDQLRERGLTCAKLKQRENKERKDMQNAFKDAQEFRKFGMLSSAELQEKVGKAQEELAEKLKEFRKKACALR